MTIRLLASLYTAQFIGVGFLTVGLTAILRQEGVSLASLGLIQLLGLFWPLKFLWAPLVDRLSPRGRAGHYRSWLLVLQSGMVLSLLGLAFFSRPGEQLGALSAVVALFVVMSATQDIAADAISVRGLEGRLRDIGSSIQVSASYLGNLVGGAGAVVIADRWGLPAAALFLAGATALVLVPVFRYREPELAAAEIGAGGAAPWRRDFWGVFRDPACRRWCLAVMPLLYAGAAGVYSLVTPALGDAGRSLSEIGLITLTWASIPALLAGLLAGQVDARLGRRGGIVLGSLLLAGGAAALTPVFTGGGTLVGSGAGVALLLSGYTMLNVTVYTQALRFARRTHAGSDFTLLTCIPLGLSFLSAWVALTVAQGAGYTASAWIMTAVALCGSGAAFRMLGRPAEGPSPASPATPAPASPGFVARSVHSDA
ncbi:MFS transporter [Arthrobacter sp. UM1]|uniref:MFS transporter n=1 Tax=Arthrobacter sp. UM1 TaxID=2766776 RepID=UPI001CF669E2|nr:MFS transporter [Arthrobacter sp. UM1]MCB4208390.1 MFS transporter [Arthrobacter sp. UM1]